MAKRERQTIFQICEILPGKSGNYLVTKFLGQGVYGQVVECIHPGTMERMAVKILQKHFSSVAEREVTMFQELEKHLDQNKNNLVRLADHFTHKGHACLAFEMLDISLQELVETPFIKPVSLSHIRIITQQMLVALNALKSVGVVHADIKPDNIMLVNHKSQPFKLKLIDFGLAMPVSKMRRGYPIQSLAYRAPEVILGLPLNEAVDMWSLGCVLAFMYLGRHLFAFRQEHEVIGFIVQIRGQPGNDLLDSGIYTHKYFVQCPDSPRDSWKLIKGAEARPLGHSQTYTSLNDILRTRPEVDNATEHEDAMAFLSLLKRMLHVDPETRITPSEALGHRFITMKHLSPDITNNSNSYSEAACLAFEKSQCERSSLEFKHFVTSSEAVSSHGPFSSDDLLAGQEEINTKTYSIPADTDETVADGPRYATTTTADGTAAGNDDGPPATAGLDEAAAAETDKKPPGTNEAPSPASVNCNSDRNTSRGRGDNAKTLKTWFQRQYSKVMNCVCAE